MKQTDYDGSFHYSKVISVFSGRTSLDISGLTVADQQLSFYCSSLYDHIIAEIYNLAGRQVASERMLTVKGYSKKDVNLEEIPQGLYLLKVSDGINTVVKKFIF